MTTAAIEPIGTSNAMDVVSPELVLVDPRLADRARALLPEDLERRVVPEPDLVEEDAAAEDARRRLLEAGVDSDVIGSLVPGPRLQRWTALVATCSTAVTGGALVLLQGLLGHGTR